MRRAPGKFQSDRQNFFHLACIQAASLGLSGIIIGKTLSIQYGAGTAICSIAIGNLILWLIAVAVISMVDRTQSTAIDNIKSYLGKYGGVLIAIIFLFAFLGWYALQIDFCLKELGGLHLYKEKLQKGMLIRAGAVLGLVATTLSMGGIRLLRKIAVFSFPMLAAYHLYAVATSSSPVSFRGTWGVSFQAVLAAVLSLLPGVINFPTFFRHSVAKTHSFLALTLITIFITLFEISTIWMDFTGAQSLIPNLLLLLFSVLTLTICNLLNIYLASASWEAIIPHFGGPKGFAIIGLLGTLTYTFIQITSPVKFLQDLTNSYIAILGVVLLFAYLLRITLKHRLRPFEKGMNLVTWLFGCAVATVYEIQHFPLGIQALLAGINASLVFILCVIFVEETVWALRKKIKWNN
jgi:purine-cytosine permease-like protein